MSALAVLIQERVQRTPDGSFLGLKYIELPILFKVPGFFPHGEYLGPNLRSARAGRISIPAWCNGVGVIPLTDTKGLAATLLSQRLYRRQLAFGLKDSQAAILRVPFFLSDLATITLRRLKIPFGADVVGDCWDALSPGSGIGGALVEAGLEIFFHLHAEKDLPPRGVRQICHTSGCPQARYPCPGPQFAASDVMLDPEAYTAAIKPFPNSRPLRLISVGTLETLYKAPDIQIECVRLLREAGLDARLTLVGDGKHRGKLISLAAKKGLAEVVTFRGQLPSGQAIGDELDQAHIFIMPSLAEGLPRSLLEAMARGLPCVGTSVGGIVELLSETDLVPPRNARALADRITEIAGDEMQWVRSAGHNLTVSREYEKTHVRTMLGEFLTYLRDSTC